MYSISGTPVQRSAGVPSRDRQRTRDLRAQARRPVSNDDSSRGSPEDRRLALCDAHDRGRSVRDGGQVETPLGFGIDVAAVVGSYARPTPRDRRGSPSHAQATGRPPSRCVDYAPAYDPPNAAICRASAFPNAGLASHRSLYATRTGCSASRSVCRRILSTDVIDMARMATGTMARRVDVAIAAARLQRAHLDDEGRAQHKVERRRAERDRDRLQQLRIRPVRVLDRQRAQRGRDEDDEADDSRDAEQ